MFIINGYVWKIIAVPPYSPYLTRDNGLQAIGVCDNFYKTIYINDELSGSLLYRVICHEITHAAMFSYNIQLSLYQEELIADIIATYGQEIVNITNELFKIIKRTY